MIRSVLSLAERSVANVVTVRTDVEWIDAALGIEHATERPMRAPHTRLLVGNGDLDDLPGVVQSRGPLAVEGDAISVDAWKIEASSLASAGASVAP